MTINKFDVLIVGAGLNGLLAASILSKKGINIGIIDKSNFLTKVSIARDFRTTAIAEGSKIFLESFKIWDGIKKNVCPIKSIKVLDRKYTNKIDFSNPDKKSFLGYVVKNKFLKQEFIKLLVSQKNVKIMPNSVLQDINLSNNYVSVQTEKYKIRAKLLIAADGKNSYVRKKIKTPIFFKNYNHKAIVINLSHNKNHNNTAYELFLKNGPLAILPMLSKKQKKYNSSIVWSHNSDFISSMENIEQQELKDVLEEMLQKHIGNITNIEKIGSFNLSGHINSIFYDKRLIYLGDAAHTIHPIAGQGWNLGVRDINKLSEVIDEAQTLGLDIGSEYICKKYHDKTFQDAFALYNITDKLNYLFILDNFFVKKLRNIGFEIIDKNIKLNNFISSFAMGKRL